MKIGIDISQIVYQTGVSRYTAELVRNLLKFDEKNQYSLYAGSLRARPTIKAFVATLPRKTKLVLTPLSPKLAEMAFNKFNLPIDQWLGAVDVFHASNWTIPKTQVPLVTTIHDLTFLKYPQEHLASQVAAHRRQLERAKKRAAAIIAVSQATKKDLIEAGIKAEKIHVIYEAAAAIFKPLEDKRKLLLIKAKYQLTKPFILSVGTQEPRKNIKRLIQAYEGLKPKNLELVIVGKFGWGEKTKPVPGVRLLGFVPDEDLVGLYSAAQVFVYPSLYEGFGLPVVEALSCGCPVVTSNVSSLPEIGGPAAVYVDPTSVKGITQGMVAAMKQAKFLRPAGLLQAKQFSWEKTARETLKIYHQVYAHRH